MMMCEHKFLPWVYNLAKHKNADINSRCIICNEKATFNDV